MFWNITIVSLIAAYIGKSIPLERFLIQPKSSIYKQASHSFNSRYLETAENSLFADGFGIGWLQDGTTCSYTRAIPIWKDFNLPALGLSLQAETWCGCVTGSEARQQPAPRQPFRNHEMLFIHQGFVENFEYSLKPACLEYIQPEAGAELQGQSVSDYLFGLLLQRLSDPDHVGIESALQDMLSTLEVSLRNLPSQLNIIVATASRLITIRYATVINPAPIYYSIDHPEFPHAGLISSRPWDNESYWQELPPQHLISIHWNSHFEIVRI